MINDHVFKNIALCDTRRVLLGKLTTGIGSAALASLLNPRPLGAAISGLKQQAIVDPVHFPAKAKRVIFLCQAGGMSHLETFDEKPKLAVMDGQPMPKSVTQGQPIAQLQGQNLSCLGPQHPFLPCGKSGLRISSILPHIADVADELCIVNSAQTEQINHDPAHTFMNTGTQISGRPAMGAWLTYGLGNEAENLPGFVVLTSAGGGQG